MSENFFLFFEEADWSDRGKSKGFINGVSLSSFVIHKGGASTQHSLFSQYYLCRNHFIYLAKRAGWRKFYLIPIICFIKMLKYYLIANNKGLDTVVEALHDALTFKN
jgi:GT2 family glycosyltransferase